MRFSAHAELRKMNLGKRPPMEHDPSRRHAMNLAHGIRSLPVPVGALDRISHLPVPCHDTINWAKEDPSEFIDELLGPVPSLFGRLVLLSTFLDRGQCRYVVQLDDSVCQCPVISDVLRETHSKYLSEWLSMSLHQKVKDISLYLESVHSAANMAKTAVDAGKVHEILPESADTPHLDHLLADARLCLALVEGV